MPPHRNLATGPNALKIRSPEGNVHPEPMDIPIDEVAPSSCQVMDVIGKLMSALDRNRVARHPVKVTGCSLKDFCSHHSISFDGRGDHMTTNNWLNDVKELLATTGCMNKQKVAYSTYKQYKRPSAGGRIRR